MEMEETTPLLLGDEAQRRQRPPIPGSFLQARSVRSICFVIALFSFLLSVSGAVSDVPTTRLIEDHICRSYYDEQSSPPADIDEAMCKVDEVQSRMVFLNGWISMIQGTLELLVAFPYGIYADRNGRKTVLRLSLLGVILQSVYGWGVLAMGQAVSINLLLASPLLVLAGGGGTVLVSTMYSIISDVADEASRVNAFLSLLVGGTMGDLVGLLLASRLMLSSPWLPIGLSLVVIALAAGTMVFIPETLPPRKRSPDSDMYDDGSPLAAVGSHARELRDQLATAARMLRQPSLCLVLFAFLCPVPVGMATSTLFVQYVSKRFGWSMASVGYLLSVKTVVNILVIAVAIPGLSRLLMSGALVRSLSVRDKDKILAQASAFALVIGFALLAAGASIGVVVAGLIVKTLGGGLSSLCRSLATAHTTPDNTAKLQTVIGIITTVGMLVAAPTLAFLFSLGMRLGGVMIGLPYAAMTFYLAVTAFALCFVRTAAPEDADALPEAYSLQEVVMCDSASIRSFQSHNSMSSGILLRRSRASSHSA